MDDDKHFADESNQIDIVFVLIGNEDDCNAVVDLIEAMRLEKDSDIVETDL
jgi:hypothetical protein